MKRVYCPLCGRVLNDSELEDEYDCLYCKVTFQLNLSRDWKRMEWREMK